MHTMMEQAAMTGALPIFTIFLNENSKPSAKSKNITPISAQRWMLPVSITDGV